MTRCGEDIALAFAKTGRVPVAAMREANYRVDRDADKQSPDEAARWLAGRIGL